MGNLTGSLSQTMPRKAAEFWWNIKRSNENRFKAPRNVCYFERNNSYEKWIPITWKHVFAKRTEKQKNNLKLKLRHETERACFIWVFFNDTNFFSGWYIYIKTLKQDYALNFSSGHREKQILDKIMNLIHCKVISFDFDTWAQAFEKQYHHEGFKRTKQGLLKCYCLIDEYGRLKDVYPAPLTGKSFLLKTEK